jgi:ACT domain-containing protein
MPIATEPNIHLENRPGALAKVCKALAERKVNILAIHRRAQKSGALGTGQFACGQDGGCRGRIDLYGDGGGR